MASVSSKDSRRKNKSEARSGRNQATALRPGFLASPRTPWILAAVLVLVTIGAYFPVHDHPFFTLDDGPYVVNNPHLLSGSAWDTITWAFTTYDLANWHPVTWLSHAADARMFQSASGHHDMNLLLHVINALLLFWVLLRATGYSGRSFMVAALFALHPINVETVAWIAERKNVLSLLFFLLALGAYRWYASKPQVSRYIVVALLYALGLMAKPQVITFPFVLLLWDYWPLQRFAFRHSPSALRQNSSGEISDEKRMASSEWRWLFLEKLPLLALSLGSAIMTMKAQGAAGALRYYPLSIRLENAIVSYVRYIGKAFWPSRLAVFYPHPDLSAWQPWAALLLLLAITGFVIQQRRQRYLAVGWFWYLGTLVPMIGIVQVGEQAMADRYAYLSFIGLFLMVCWGVAELAEQRQLSPAWLAAPSVAVLLVLTVMTYRQLSYWSDNVTLWSRMMAISSGSYEVEENLAVALVDNGQAEPAMQHFERVTALVPSSPGLMGRELAGYAAVAHLYLGAYDQQRGQPADAIAHYKKVLEMAQNFASQNVYANLPPLLTRMKAAALGNMGDAYYALHDFPNAKTSFEAALQLDPRSPRQWIGLGVVEEKSGDAGAAAQAFSRATEMQPSAVG
ncbi:MAG: tetratricopeptide repeat protein, partial [Candidatus Korobacteraceae bacterium]